MIIMCWTQFISVKDFKMLNVNAKINRAKKFILPYPVALNPVLYLDDDNLKVGSDDLSFFENDENGDPKYYVNSWSDPYNNKEITQTTGSYRPIYKKVNGVYRVFFDGTNDYMDGSVSGNINDNGLTLFALINYQETANNWLYTINLGSEDISPLRIDSQGTAAKQFYPYLISNEGNTFSAQFGSLSENTDIIACVTFDIPNNQVTWDIGDGSIYTLSIDFSANTFDYNMIMLSAANTNRVYKNILNKVYMYNRILTDSEKNNVRNFISK